MVARPSTPYRSANAGEFSADAQGRVDIKQYYSAGLAYKNVEPVPQSGFRQMGGSWKIGDWRKPLIARAITSPAISAGPHVGTQTVWTGTVAGAVAAVLVTSFAISAGTATFEVQAEIAGVWTKIAGPFAVATGAPVTRLAAFAPGAQAVATGLRIRATFSIPATVTIGSVAALEESGTALTPRYADLTTDEGAALLAIVTEGVADFFNDGGYVGSARLSAVTAAMLPDLGFYAEGRTIGVFHGELETERLFLATAGQLADWRVDLWPYAPVPTADLGGVYPTTADVWEVFIKWTDAVTALYISVTVDGESTPGLALKNAGVPTDPDLASSGSWDDLAAEIQAALVTMPALGAGVTVVQTDPSGGRNRKLTVTFGGDLAGEEYELGALIVNTSDASALAYHIEFGDTEFADVFSTLQGWPGFAALAQDRLGYGRIPSVTGALALSRIGEYFDLNTEAVTDQAARLDKLRSQTSETILHLKEGNFLLVFTDLGVYFATNRTIERNTPLNFVRASEIGAQPNAVPFDLEGTVYYVAIGPKGLAFASEGGKQLLSVLESPVTSTTSFQTDPVSLLASHLVDKLLRSVRQRPEGDLDAAKGWLMRSDGRLVAAQMIRNQEITGFCEWIAAGGGLVREIRIDGRNRLWLAVERGSKKTHELYDISIFLQDAIEAETDLAGLVAGLAAFEGDEVWALADGYVLGPFTVAAGAIDLEDPYDDVLVGRWQAPRFESMPHVYVTPADEVIFRPGRIHTAHLNIIGTTSIAIGANGETPEDVPLLETGDLTDAPVPAKTQLLTVSGLTGFVDGPTLVVTQTRPGALRVRDFAVGAKL